jgi:hypothetical protein
MYPQNPRIYHYASMVFIVFRICKWQFLCIPILNHLDTNSSVDSSPCTRSPCPWMYIYMGRLLEAQDGIVYWRTLTYWLVWRPLGYWLSLEDATQIGPQRLSDPSKLRPIFASRSGTKVIQLHGIRVWWVGFRIGLFEHPIPNCPSRLKDGGFLLWSLAVKYQELKPFELG